MADRTAIQIPVEVQLKLSKSADELKQLADDFQEKFSNIDPTSSLYKGLNKLFQQMEGKFTKIKSLTGKSFFSDSDFKRVVKYFEDIDELASTINNKTSKVGATALGIDVPGLKEAKQLLADIRQSARADKNKNVGQVMSKADLVNFEKYAKDSKFSAGKNYESNTKAMASAVGELTVKFYQLEDAAKAAGEAEQQAIKKVENAKAARDAIDKQVTDKTMALQNAKSNRTKMSQQLETQLQSVKGPYGSGDKKRVTEDILNDYKEIISNVIQAADGSFVDDGKTFASILGNWLKVEPNELQAEANQVVATLQQALVKAATNDKGNVTYGSLKKVVGSFTAKIAPETFLKEEQELQQLQNELATKTQKLEDASRTKDAASINLAEVKKNLTETETLLRKIQVQLEQLKKMRMEYEQGISDSYTEQERQAREHHGNLEKLGAKDIHDSGKNFSEKVGAARQDAGNKYDSVVIHQQEQSAAEAEARQFADNLKQSVRHWMSAAQIVNIIRNGIRTAISDIKSLDKAMTDIAVVTDMSVSDLWGKINEYMAIAQEYGVTTQGVYEVSQLYYQQGLSTSEVMSATTETLKMARIAGMDYKDAADAMTVAIRAFKMEMSDAQHVTDVYSKVAAVTASDTNELATAMSKTASSAESVGSSFENTTAMLAVMIETTRESAQNLGSALKSIISRYGEMKVGLTEDSEGEEIDYNKVDTALKSVGISIKDAQGQFRDFDDVIFELSEKWDTLDKNTQRYIATIMAGNRQQSRFIALVDNWERLDEIVNAAQDSEDAGLLQYAKTLDSIETKLNNIKTSFQQFYMSIFNGGFVNGILDFINNFIKALNKLGTLGSIFNLITLVKGVKTGLNLIIGLFSANFKEIYRNYKSMQQRMTNIANTESKKRANIQAENEKNGQNSIGNNYIGKRSQAYQAKLQSQKAGLSKIGTASNILSLLGLGVNLFGTSAIANKTFGKSSTAVGTGINAVGNTASGVGTGMGIGAAIGSVIPGLGTAVGAAIGSILGGLTPAINGLKDTIEAVNQIEKEYYENLKETTEEKNVERAQVKDEYQNLANLIKQVENTELIKNNSADDYQNWLDVNNSLIEAYPELLGYIDQEGNAIADLTGKTEILTYYMQRAASATAAYYEAKIREIDQKILLGGIGLSTKYGSKDENNKFFLNGLGTKITYKDVHDKVEKLDVNLAEALSLFNSLILRDNLKQGDITGAIDDFSAMSIFGEYVALYEDGSKRAIAQAELIERMISVGALTWNSKNNQYELSSNYVDYAAGKSAEKELSATKRQGAIAGITNAAALNVEDDNLEQISGYSALIATYALDILNKPYESLLNIAEDEYSALIADFLALSNTWDTQGQAIIKNLYSQLTTYSLPELQKIFNEHLGGTNNKLYEAFELEWYNQNTSNRRRQIEAIYGKDFFTEYADNLGISEASEYAKKNGEEASSDYILWWQERFQKTANYSDWLEHVNLDDTAESKKLYYAELNYMLNKYQGQLNNFLMNASVQTVDQYTSYLAKETKISENEGIEGQKATLRLAVVQNLLEQMWNSNTVLGKVLEENEAYVEFSNLLLADNIGTNEWAVALSEFEKKYNIEIANFENYVFENFNTQLNTALDNLNNDLATYKNYSDKQSSGFSLDEARSLAKTLGGDEGTIERYFTTTVDGLLVLKDFESTMRALLSENTIKAKNLQSDLNTILRPLQNFTTKETPESVHVVQGLLDKRSDLNIEEATNILSDELGYNKRISELIAEQIKSGVITDMNLFYYAINEYNKNFQESLESILTVKDSKSIETYLINILGTEPELAASLATIIANGEFKTIKELTAYLQEYQAELGLALDQAYGQAGAVIEAQRKNSKIEELKFSATTKGIHFDKLEAQKLLASQGLTGYSKEQMADLALAFNWKEGIDFILQDDGTYDINYQTLTKNGLAFLNSLAMEYRNQLLALLDSETNSALETISNLDASVAKGDTGVYGAAFGDVMDYQLAELFIPQYIKAAHEGTLVSGNDPADRLKGLIADQISKETGKTVTINNPEVIKRYNEMMNGYSAQLDNNLIKFLELKEKELFGTILSDEQATLDNLNLNDTLKAELTSILSQAGSSTVDKYVAIMRAALASGADWAEIEKYVSNGYKAKFAKLFSGFDVTDLDTYKSIDTIEGAAGQYTENMLTSIATQLTAEAKAKGKSETDITTAMTAFENAFEYDTETGVAKLKSDASWSTIFAQFLNADSSIPQWLQPFIDAFNASEVTEAMNDSVRTADLPGKIKKTIGSMFSNYADITLESFISFYDDIFGSGSYQALDDTTKENYLAAIQAAQKGNLSSLKTQIDSIATKIANEKGIQIDTTAVYNDTIRAINAQFLEYQLKAIQGTITETEQSWLDGLALDSGSWQKILVDELADELVAAGTDTITKYSAMIKAAINSRLPWEQVSGIVQNAYDTQLTLLANAMEGTSIKKVDTYAAINGIEEAQGYYTKEVLAGLFSQMGAEGIAIDISKVKEYFTWDKAAQAWILQEGKNIDEALTALFGDSAIPPEVVAAFKISQDQKEAGDLVRANTLAKNITKTISDMMRDLTNISLAEIEKLYESVNNKEIDKSTLQVYKDAIEQAEAGNVELLCSQLLVLVEQAKAEGYDIDTSAIEAAYKDTATTLIQSLISMLEAGVSGTLSATDMLSLAEKTGINIQQYATNTVDGYKLSTEGLLQVGSYLEKTYGGVYNVAEKLVDSFVGEGMTYSGVEDLLAAAEGLEKVEGKVTEQYESQYKLLTKMANISRLNPDDPLFNFMDQESTRGMANGFDNMVSSIDAVKSAFSSIKSGDIIDNDTFYNMMDFMYKSKGEGISDRDWLNTLGFSNETIDNLIAQEELTFNTYDDFVNAMVSSSKELGGIDGEVLMDMGFSMEAAANGMSESLKEVADNQIDFLENIKETLLAMKTLEGLEEINIGLGFSSEGQEINLANISEHLNEEGLELNIIDKIEEIQQTLGKNAFDMTDLFSDGIFNLSDNADIAVAEGLGKFIQFYKSSTKEELIDFARTYPELLSEETGTIDWNKLAKIITSVEDWRAFADGVEFEVENAVNTALITKGGLNLSLNETTGKLEFNINKDWNSEELINAQETAKQAIINQYAALGKDVEVKIEGQTITIDFIDPQVKTTIETLSNKDKTLEWNYNFETDSYTTDIIVEASEVPVKLQIDKFGAITAVDSQGHPIENGDSIIEDYLQAHGISYAATEEGISTGITITAPPSTEETVQIISQNIQTIVDALNNGIPIIINDEEASSVLEGIQAAYELLHTYITEHPLTINSSNSGSIIINGSTPQEGENGESGDIEPLTQPVKLEWDKESLNGWKQENLKQEVDLDYNINTPSLSTLTRKVRLDYDSASADLTVTVHDGASGATGNVALAMGRLMTGAALARGTLMGELGPELYVQNGQYHIAGANGPEFVDLAPDAIVFNHLQTAGLLNKGHISSKGSPVTSEKRSVGAYATGNVSGTALASGIDGAIEAIDRAIAQWKQIAKLSAKELLDASGGGGGGGNSIKAVTQELQEWYNLLRKIEKLEKDINLLQAERNNLAKGDGAARLRSMRQEQQLLREQAATQAVLLDYQRLQLDRQKIEITKPDSIWSQFLEIGENGLLQYKKGNETNGGKGALEVLQELNEMSGEDQIKFLEDLGYTYTTADGEELKDSALVEQFYQELQDQIDQYDALYDTVRKAEIALENYTNKVNELEEEIRQNKLDLEQSIYDIIVEAWEKEIELLEEQAELIQEANDTYINGIREAVNTEKELYDQNQKTADRESLQRQLSLLRRSGGSASEIANLEKQLDDMLKDEYFEHQEDMIENIQEANDKQIKLLEQQIKIQQESLEYQQEHGIIWEQVARVMSLSQQEILDFMQGTAPGFFAKSAEQQYDTLMDWSEKVGIFTEDRKLDQYASEGIANYFDNGNIWDDSSVAGYQSTFNSMSKSAQSSIRTMFGEAYAQAINEGQDSTNARNVGIAAITPWLNGTYDAEQAEQYNEPTRPTGGNNSGYTYMEIYSSDNGGPINFRSSPQAGINNVLEKIPQRTKVSVISTYDSVWSKVKYNGKEGYIMTRYLREASGYAQGGLVDYTGLAMVHGSKKKPESFLNAEQTARITDALKAQQNINPLKETLSRLQNAINLLGENIRSIIIPSANQANNINIASGAITISVQELNDSYDIDEVVNDIQGRILSIAAKSTNRSVNRR